MAEDRNRVTAHAPEEEEDLQKAELQRRMEQARETITQTVTEIKDTVTNQYQSVRETISETLDWREQFRKRPVAWSIGALSVGFLTGYGIAAAIKGNGGRYDYPSNEETDIWNVGAPLAAEYSSGAQSRTPDAPARSYAAQAITGSATEHADYDEGGKTEESSGPSLIDRFKETKAFDRLQDEVSKLGDRFIEQLSSVGQEVVLPALFGKIKEMIGVDLSGKKEERGSRAQATGASTTGASSSASAGASSGA